MYKTNIKTHVKHYLFLFLLHLINPLKLMDFPVHINWTSPFLFLELIGGNYHLF